MISWKDVRSRLKLVAENIFKVKIEKQVLITHWDLVIHLCIIELGPEDVIEAGNDLSLVQLKGIS